MRQSQLFGKTLRESPKDAKAQSHIFLLRGGFISQLMSGVYNFEPLGFRVLKKIENIIREELNEIGVQEVLMPILQPAEIWKKTGRWQEIGPELMRIKDQKGADFALSMTHEEAMADMTKPFIKNRFDLPVILNQFQTKIRDEERPRAGLLRLKEFIMQDAYSFDADENELKKTYKKVFQAYQRIFKRLDLKVTAQKADPGIMGGSESHEFKMLSEIGEDELNGKPAIELGHTFNLGTKYSKAFDIYYKDKNGHKKLVIMASYGIGLNRVMAALVEAHHDKNGIVWPKSVSPFDAHLICLKNPENKINRKVVAAADKVYKDLLAQGIEVLYDDRQNKTAGEKFSDSDLIGIPVRIVVSEKSLAKNSFELKDRKTGRIKLVKISDLKNTFK